MKTTWRIINEEKGKTKSSIDIQSLVINNNVIIRIKLQIFLTTTLYQ